tara:strand:- start:8820 stop:10235 length:1416 start_codon:yes stop_codon:yes gene_type:complete
MTSYSDGIKNVQFTITSPEVIEKKKCVDIVKGSSYKHEQPLPNGVYDAHLGTTSNDWNCETCGNKKGECLGHPGMIAMRYPVKNPLFISFLVAWLKAVCFNCGNLVIPSSSRSIKEVAKKIGGKTKDGPIKCETCSNIHYHIVVDKGNTLLINKQITYPEVKARAVFEPMYNMDILDVFRRVPMELTRQFNMDPRSLLFSLLPVSSNIIRPDTKISSQERFSTSDSTTSLKKIVEINNILPENSDVLRAILNTTDLNSTEYNNMIKNITMLESEHVNGMIIGGNADKTSKTTSSTTTIQSYKDELSGKSKLIRKNMMGKRSDNTGRAVIVGDPTLALTEWGIPKENAFTHFVREVVQPFNKERLTKLLYNMEYPQILNIERNSNKYIRTVETGTFKMIDSLQFGDIVERQLMDGDMFYANRQPTLHKPSMSGMRARVIPGKVFRLNPSSCAPFNADFDGKASLSTGDVKSL